MICDKVNKWLELSIYASHQRNCRLEKDNLNVYDIVKQYSVPADKVFSAYRGFRMQGVSRESAYKMTDAYIYFMQDKFKQIK